MTRFSVSGDISSRVAPQRSPALTNGRGGEFEVEENSGALNVVFEEPPGKFVITPNAPVRQIWISALSTSYKLDWSDDASDFILPKDNIAFRPLVARLINQHLGSDTVVLI